MKKLLFALSGLVIVGFAVWFFDSRKVRPPDYCPKPDFWLHEGWKIPGHTALLVDTSNEISPEDGARAFSRIEALFRDTTEVPRLQLVTMHGLAEDGTVASAADDRRCVPLQGAMANRIYANPRWVQIDFERWLNKLEETFEGLVNRGEAPQSPLVEVMARLAQARDSLDSMVIVSDMLQNSPLWSHYSGEGDAQAAMAECRRIRASGRVAAVYVYYINRGLAVQSRDWPTPWWQRCLRGVQLKVLNQRGP